jgi:hypothetical protein
MANATTFNYKVVRQFAIMTVIWGIVGMLVGVLVASQLNFHVLNFDTSFLTFGVAEQIAYLSERHTLLPGDIISTGVPQPTVPLKEGQTVEIVVEGLGTLRNKVVSKPAADHVKFPARKVAKD